VLGMVVDDAIVIIENCYTNLRNRDQTPQRAIEKGVTQVARPVIVSSLTTICGFMPLMLMPGSHQKYVSCVGETPEDHYQTSLQKQERGIPDQDSLNALVDQYGITQGAGPAGTLVLFDCNTMHGSNGNITPFPRSNLFFVYNSVWNQLAEPFSQNKPRPEFIASRADCEPVIQQTVNYSLRYPASDD